MHHVKLASALIHGNYRYKGAHTCSGGYMSSGNPPATPTPSLLAPLLRAHGHYPLRYCTFPQFRHPVV